MVSSAAQYNIIGEDPQLIDPENDDYRVISGTPAEDYGCQMFPPDRRYFKTAENDYSTKFSFPKHKSIIEVEEDIVSNTVWDADTVKVVDDITIMDGAVLTIISGTIIEFENFYHLNVKGAIQALGEADEIIIFTSKNPQNFTIDHTTSGAWNGIKFANTSSLNPVSTFQYCSFEYSKSFGDTTKGGVIHNYGVSNLEIINCVFSNCVADYGSAISLEYQAAPKIFGCLFENNFAFVGGSPIYCSYSYPKITNCTMINNVVLNDDIYYKTGAIQTFISKPKITNNIIWDNVSNYFTEEQLIECKGYCTTYNDIEDGHAGKGNIDEEPLFANNYLPYSLSANSPCIDRGSPDTLLFIFPEDLGGNSRIFQGKIDMGAYEWNNSNSVSMEFNNSELKLISFPNPAQNEVTFEFCSKRGQLAGRMVRNAEIRIYNIKGRRIMNLNCFDKSNRGAGDDIVFSTKWDGKDTEEVPVQTGIYFYQLFLDDISYAQNKLLLIR